MPTTIGLSEREKNVEKKSTKTNELKIFRDNMDDSMVNKDKTFIQSN